MNTQEGATSPQRARRKERARRREQRARSDRRHLVNQTVICSSQYLCISNTRGFTCTVLGTIVLQTEVRRCCGIDASGDVFVSHCA